MLREPSAKQSCSSGVIDGSSVADGKGEQDRQLIGFCFDSRRCVQAGSFMMAVIIALAMLQALELVC